RGHRTRAGAGRGHAGRGHLGGGRARHRVAELLPADGRRVRTAGEGRVVGAVAGVRSGAAGRVGDRNAEAVGPVAGLTHGQAVLESLRKHNATLIDQDPVEVSVERTTWRDDGAGGRVAEETTLGPYRCRVYHRDSETAQVVTEGAARYVDEWGVTFPW